MGGGSCRRRRAGGGGAGREEEEGSGERHYSKIIFDLIVTVGLAQQGSSYIVRSTGYCLFERSEF